MATGVALMQGGVASMRMGVAIAAAGSTQCCCGGRCIPGPNPGPCAPPCIEWNTNPVAGNIFLFLPQPNGPGVFVYNDLETVCCQILPQRRIEGQWTVRSYLPNGCNFSTHIAQYINDANGTVGTERIITRDPTTCAVLEDRTVPYLPSSGFGLDFGWPNATILPYYNTGWTHGYQRCDCYNMEVNVQEIGPDGLRRTLVGAVRMTDGLCGPFGACCCDGVCFALTGPACSAMGGDYRGDGSKCRDTNCAGTQGPAAGSCCFSSGLCADTDFNTCTQQGGTFRVGVPCAGNPCPSPEVWSCCLPSQSGCVMTTEADCLAQLGNWRRGVDCGQPCLADPIGACCFGQGECQENTFQQCAGIGGTWQGAGTICAQVNCGTGACCHDTSRGRCCTQETAAGCAQLANGVFNGLGSQCNPAPCGGNFQTCPAPPPILYGNTFSDSAFTGSRRFL